MAASTALQDDIDRIHRSLAAAQRQMRRARRRDTAAILIGLASTSVATILAGLPGLTGAFIVEGWQLTCALTASLTCVATVTAAARDLFGNTDRLVRTGELVAKLRSLEVSILGSRIDGSEADVEYLLIAQMYADLMPSLDARSSPATDAQTSAASAA